MSMLVKALAYSTVLRHFKPLMLLDFSEVFFCQEAIAKKQAKRNGQKNSPKMQSKRDS